MDLFLLDGVQDDLSLTDMIERDLKASEYGMTSQMDEFNSIDFAFGNFESSFENDVCMRTLEPLFDGVPSLDLMENSPCGAGATPAASSTSTYSSCSSSSSLEDDQGRLALEQGINEISWLGASNGSFSTSTCSSSSKDLTFDVDTAIMVNPSSVLPSTLPSRCSSLISSSTASASSPSSSSSSGASPLLSSSPSPLLSSSPVLLTSCSNSSSSVILNNTPSSSVFSNLSQSTFLTTTSSSSKGNINNSGSNATLLSGNSTQTVYIKTEPVQNNNSVSSTVQLCSGSVNSSGHVTVLRPTITTSTNNPTTPTIIATPRTLTQHNSQGTHHHHNHHQQHRLHLVNNTSNGLISINNASNNNSNLSNNSSSNTKTIVAHSTARLTQQQQLVTSGPMTTVHTTSNNSGHVFRGKPASVRSAPSRRTDERVMPKPAYSYSCLIALALKNSATGSLPVSEIYSFMCEYFPYFRTAPNGWKNSVRHNLSLNKCFEKIEKPVVSGNNQRKGCLWALNPNKVHKMDEEIQKWSKKDLQGIRDAMNTPDVLSALERGEMKFEAASSTSLCSEDEDEDEEVDPLTLTDPPTTLATLKFVNGGTTNASNHHQPQQSRTISIGQQQQHLLHQQPRTTLQIHTNKQPTILRQGSQLQQKIRANNATAVFTATSNNISNSIAASASPTGGNEPEFILPDSTMTEISFQSGTGMIIDDLGNEISIDEEEGVSSSLTTSNNLVSNVSVVSSPRSVVLRKLPGITPVRSNGTSLRTNYVYSPSLTSPHQHGLNRLVLTNAKMTS